MSNKTKKPILRSLRRSHTISVSECVDPDDAPPLEVSFEGSSIPRPTSSCQALRHAVSALNRLDDFHLEELGSGFFANVYKATHRTTGEEMVMKINKDSSNKHNALREVQLMNRLSHPNILTLLGVCVHEGQLHGLTEYISGGTLNSLLSDNTEELPWTLRIKLSLDIARGMHYLHTDGTIHRDLTSKNILIKKNSKIYQAIIADFGLATKIPDPNASEPLPVVGCPWWMAPEVINAKFYNQRADIFSFGILNVEITARIDADPETMPRTQNFGIDYVSLCDMFEYCPLDFLQLTFKCCQVLSEKRPTSCTIKTTLEQIYKNFHGNSIHNLGFSHKRSRSEDNIIQSSESEEAFMTPQIIAEAMSKDDPHYTPAVVNPFASLSKFKYGRKVLGSSSRSRKSSGGSGNFPHGKSDQMSASFNGQFPEEDQQSQSLPASPISMRRAAEKLHQASLHGRDWFKELVDSRKDFRDQNESKSLDRKAKSAVDKRASFGCSRTRSLGDLDNNAETSNYKVKFDKLSQRDQDTESQSYCVEGTGGIKEASFEDSYEDEDFYLNVE